ncbi:MAG TPA: hypothetical protein VFV57_01025 [Limnobacter sp.]|nr:hypothetical protein [Limnobacter sp.]
MYKFMFVALMASAIYPDWPMQAVVAGQDIIQGFQSKVIVVGHNMAR